MNDDIVILTIEQAISLLPDAEIIHNFANPRAGMFIGCDYSHDDAIKTLREAKQIEIGGDNCKAMKHPLVCWHTETRCTFFEADIAKIEAFEAALFPKI